MIIGFSGKKGSGKNFYSNYLIEKYNFKELSFAYPLKQSLKLILNLSDAELYGNKKDEFNERFNCYNREIMQWFGTEVFRENFNKRFNYKGSVWVDNVKYILENNPDNNYVISDIRFQNEIDMIHEFKGTVINIYNNDIINEDIKTLHKSENQKLVYDYKILNLKTPENTIKNYKFLDNIINITKLINE